VVFLVEEDGGMGCSSEVVYWTEVSRDSDVCWETWAGIASACRLSVMFNDNEIVFSWLGMISVFFLGMAIPSSAVCPLGSRLVVLPV
jgi:hypothetical protein